MTEDWRQQLKDEFSEFENVLSGCADEFKVRIRKIHLKSGNAISLHGPGVTVFVGANNTGKSTVLREMASALSHAHPPGPPLLSVKAVDVVIAGDVEDTIAWFGDNSRFAIENGQPGFLRSDGSLLALRMVKNMWNSTVNTLSHLAPSLLLFEDVSYRYSKSHSTEIRFTGDDPPSHPLHHLQDSPALLKRLNEISDGTFGLKLTLDPLGRQLMLRIGEVRAEVPRIDSITRDYRDEMVKLPKLEDQGDGIRGFIAQLLPILTGAYRITIIDEPEAFLHPPQAHSLGVQLGKLAAEKDIQIFLATHDKSLLAGLLDSRADISVVRLERGEGAPTSRSLEANMLRELWSDPVLKYTNVLDGLFHHLVVVAEAERDCAYLQAALDHPERPVDALPRNEIHFVPTSGTSGMARVCKALTAVGVPVVVAPDLDILSDKTRLRNLVESLGFEWSQELQDSWERATKSIRTKTEPVTVAGVLESVKNILEKYLNQNYTNSIHREVKGQLRSSNSKWDTVKKVGISAFQGQARVDVTQLLYLLNQLGIVPVEAGELESLAPEIVERKGSGWLTSALDQDAHGNQATQKHIDRIINAGTRLVSR